MWTSDLGVEILEEFAAYARSSSDLIFYAMSRYTERFLEQHREASRRLRDRRRGREPRRYAPREDRAAAARADTEAYRRRRGIAPRTVERIEFRGRLVTFSELSAECGVGRTTLVMRYQSGLRGAELVAPARRVGRAAQ